MRMGHSSQEQSIKIGDMIPNISVSLRDSEVELAEYFETRKGVFIGVNGAYEPNSTRLLTSLAPRLPELTQHVALIGVVSVNDPYVLKAWGRRLRLVDQLTFISDVNGAFSQKLGMSISLASMGFGKALRTKLFVLVVEEGAKVTYVDSISDTEKMADSLMRYISSISPAMTDKRPRIKTTLESVAPIADHPAWKKITSPMQMHKPVCNVPKFPVLPATDGHPSEVLVDRSSFYADTVMRLENDGQALHIFGMNGTIEYSGSIFKLYSTVFRTKTQNQAVHCDIELQLIFHRQSGDDGDSTVEKVSFSIPMIANGSDAMLACLPSRQDGYPIKKNRSLAFSIKDKYILENGVAYHFFPSMSLLHYQLRQDEVWFVATDCHGISKKQALQLHSMTDKDDAKPYDTISVTVHQAEIDIM